MSATSQNFFFRYSFWLLQTRTGIHLKIEIKANKIYFILTRCDTVRAFLSGAFIMVWYCFRADNFSWCSSHFESFCVLATKSLCAVLQERIIASHWRHKTTTTNKSAGCVFFTSNFLCFFIDFNVRYFLYYCFILNLKCRAKSVNLFYSIEVRCRK